MRAVRDQAPRELSGHVSGEAGGVVFLGGEGGREGGKEMGAVMRRRLGVMRGSAGRREGGKEGRREGGREGGRAYLGEQAGLPVEDHPETCM